MLKPKTKKDLPCEFSDRLMLNAADVQGALSWSRSTLDRAMRGLLTFKHPFPRPIKKFGGLKINFWVRAQLEAWLAAELAE